MHHDLSIVHFGVWFIIIIDAITIAIITTITGGIKYIIDIIIMNKVIMINIMINSKTLIIIATMVISIIFIVNVFQIIIIAIIFIINIHFHIFTFEQQLVNSLMTKNVVENALIFSILGHAIINGKYYKVL